MTNFSASPTGPSVVGANVRDTDPPGPGLWLSIGVLTLGIILASAGSWVSANRIGEFLFVESFDTPGSQVRSLDEGEYEVFALVAQVNVLQLEVENEFIPPTFEEIFVTDVDTGTQLVVTPRFPTEVGRNSFVFELVGDFTVEQDATIEINVQTQQDSRAFVSRKIETGVMQSIPWLIAAGIGVLLAALGALMLIIGSVRRRRHRRSNPGTPTYAATPPPHSPPTHSPSLAAVPPTQVTTPPLAPAAPPSAPDHGLPLDLVTPTAAKTIPEPDPVAPVEPVLPISEAPSVGFPEVPQEPAVFQTPAVPQTPEPFTAPDIPQVLDPFAAGDIPEAPVAEFSLGAPDLPEALDPFAAAPDLPEALEPFAAAPDLPAAPNVAPAPDAEHGFTFNDPTPDEPAPATPKLEYADPIVEPTTQEPSQPEQPPLSSPEDPNEAARWRIEPTADEEVSADYEVEPRTFPSMAPSKPPTPPESPYPASEPELPPLPPPT